MGDHISSYAQSIIVGFTANCPESAATVLADLKEIGPTYFFAPPRIWENILTGVMIRIEDAAWPKRAMARFFLDLAQDLERRSRVSTWGAWRAVPMPPFASGASAPSLARRRTTLLGGLMRRVFEVDVLVCPRCGGRRRLVAGYSGGHRLLEPWTGSASARLRASRPPRGSLLSTRPPD